MRGWFAGKVRRHGAHVLQLLRSHGSTEEVLEVLRTASGAARERCSCGRAWNRSGMRTWSTSSLLGANVRGCGWLLKSVMLLARPNGFLRLGPDAKSLTD